MDRTDEDRSGMSRYPGAARDSRGPIKPLGQPYVALLDSRAIAGSEATTLVDGIEARTRNVCVDLSAPHAGPDAILADGVLLEIARGADTVILTVPGAHQMTNPYYRVHNWRNDRVIAQQDRLRALYPEIEFDRHHFVRHLLEDLHAISPGRFALVRETLQRTWLMRMGSLLSELGKPVILLWIGDRRPDEECETVHDGDPPFVTREMTGALAVAARAEVTIRRPSPLGMKGRSAASGHVRSQEVTATAIDKIAECLQRVNPRAPTEQRRRA